MQHQQLVAGFGQPSQHDQSPNNLLLQSHPQLLQQTMPGAAAPTAPTSALLFAAMPTPSQPKITNYQQFSIERVFCDPFNITSNLYFCQTNPNFLTEIGLVVTTDMETVVFASPSLSLRLRHAQPVTALSQILVGSYRSVLMAEIGDDVNNRKQILSATPHKLPEMRCRYLKTEHTSRMIVREGDESVLEMIVKSYRVFNYNVPSQLDCVYMFFFWNTN